MEGEPATSCVFLWALVPQEWGAFYQAPSRCQRLGGVHTVAARRFLAYKQEEERKMLKELQLQSSDYKQALEYKKQYSPARAPCGPLEKTWTAKVVVPPEEFRMPPRERVGIGKHVERLQLARVLRNRQLPPCAERLQSASLLSGRGLGPRAAKAKAGEGEEKANADDSNSTTQEEKEEAESGNTKRQEIQMNVVFKSEEPKRCLTNHPNEQRPFLPTRKRQRSITGPTNRSVFPFSDFPGDLMLMNQDFISRGVYPSDAVKANHRREESIWEDHMRKFASHHY